MLAELLSDGRTAYSQQRWADAFDLLQRADRVQPLAAEDLVRLAWSAGMLDRDAELLATFERLYELHLAGNKFAEAAYFAFFVGFRNLALGETGRAGAWLQRAQRLVDQAEGECAASGYLLLPAAHRSLVEGDLDAAASAATQALAIGERCGDPDLAAFSRCLLGRALVRQGKVGEGVPHLDEAMLGVTARRLTPVITGLVYCNVIATCRQIYALDRAQEWTEALAGWCQAQPQLVQFNGLCGVHRAEIMELHGEWSESIAEAKRATRSLARAIAQETAAAAAYQRAEIHRLRGELDAAESAYREAGRSGWDPQPGLALLRLAQGNAEQAATAIRRTLAAMREPLDRARILPAGVEVLLAAGARAEATALCSELVETARRFSTDVLGAIAAQSKGAVALAEGNAGAALSELRSAFSIWQKLGAPYLAARCRTQMGIACRLLGDEEGAVLEWESARAVFTALGALPDIARIDILRKPSEPRARNGLTARELEVLGMIAAGKTNKAIASELELSEKTIDRHVSNIFDKIAVSSRAAATAYAYRNGLL